MPFFESPDENAHADYAFTLFTLKAPVPLAGRSLATNVDPLVVYLESVSDFGKIHYNPDGRVRPGYGSAAFLRAVDAGAPAVPRDFLEHNGRRVPFVVRSYSYFYYALDALGIEVGALLTHGSATGEFLAARAFNLILLLCSLWLAYLTFRELRIAYWGALALTATIGFFPLTSWVSAYVQPDNLSFTSVTLVLYLAVRLRRDTASLGATAMMGLALGVLALTKAQYFVVVAVPVLADATLRLATRRPRWPLWMGYVTLGLGPAFLAWLSVRGSVSGADQQLAYGATIYGNPLAEAARLGLLPLLQTLFSLAAKAFLASFYNGLAFYGYWGGFSWDDTKIRFGSDAVTALVFAALGGCSLIVAALVACRLALGVWPRLIGIARHRGPLSAARLALADVHLNAYLCFVALMLGLNVISGGLVGGAGRYWLPLIVCSLLCATRCAPRALPSRLRRPFRATVGGGALLYSVAAAIASPASIESRFYTPPPHPLAAEADALIRHIDGVRVATIDAGHPLRLSAARCIEVDGVALDSHATLPVLFVDVAVDGAPVVRAHYGLHEPNVVAEMHDDRLLPTGYAATLDLSKFAPGPHELSLLVGEPNRNAPWPSALRVPFTIESSAATRQAGRNRRAPM